MGPWINPGLVIFWKKVSPRKDFEKSKKNVMGFLPKFYQVW
jgi:hypothetical protein